MSVDGAYLELLNSNLELRKKLVQEETNNISNKEKIRKLVKEIESCERYISFLEKKVVSREDEIERLKAECQSTLHELEKCQERLEDKEEALVIQDNRIIQLEDTVEKLRTDINNLICKNNSIDSDMARANPDPIQRILNDYLPGITVRLQQIRKHTERRVPLTPNNLEIRYDDINQFLDSIRRDATPLQNAAFDLRNLRQNLNNITAERDQYQNLLNEENRQVGDLRQQLNEARAQALRTDRMMTDALRDERNARREYWEIAENRKERIGELLREKFAFRLLIQRKETQIAEHRRNAHRLMLRYNNDMDRLNRRYRADTERWRRKNNGCIHQARNWKGQFRASQTQNNNLQQQINILQQQILILQNNAPVNQPIVQPHMANIGLRLPTFYGDEGEDHEDYVCRMIGYINSLPALPNDANLQAILDQSIRGEARTWFDQKFNNKNWQLDNILDTGALANIAAIRTAPGGVPGNAGNLQHANEVLAFPPGTPIRARVDAGATGAQIIPARGIYEDWYLAGGRPTPNAPVAPAAGGNTPVILAGIRPGQRLWWFRCHYKSVDKDKRKMEMGLLRQEPNETVAKFWSRVNHCGDQLHYNDALKKSQFLNGVRDDIKQQILLIGSHKSMEKILDRLERYELDQDVLPNSKSMQWSKQGLYTQDDINRILKQSSLNISSQDDVD